MTRNVLISALLALSACGPSTEVVMLGPVPPGLETVSPDSILVFSSERRVLVEFDPIARIEADIGASGEWAAGSFTVYRIFREKASDLGADAIILGEMQEKGLDRPARGEATAVRLRGIDPGESGRILRSPAEVRTIAVAPTLVPPELLAPDSVMADFDWLIHDRMRSYGLEVLPPSLHDSIWVEHVLALGGIFDPVFGERFDDRVRQAHEWTVGALIDGHGADAILYPEVRVVLADFEGAVAEWDGASQVVDGSIQAGDKVVNTVLTVLELVTTEEEDEWEEDDVPVGSLKALTLSVQVENSLGARIYHRNGGIHLLEGADLDFFEKFEFSPEDMFGNAERIGEAVRMALEAFPRGR
jgi:hypothetical protein